MIDFPTINPALVSLFAGLADLQVNYKEKRRDYTDPVAQARLLLRWRDAESIGVDDRRPYCPDPDDTEYPAPPIVVQQVGLRRVGLDVQIESFRHDDDRFAFHRVEKIRTGLDFPSVQEALSSLNVAIITKSRTLDVSNVIKDQHVTSVAVLDLILAIGACADDPVRQQVIETVVVTYQGQVT
jgi:hypothetical protein